MLQIEEMNWKSRKEDSLEVLDIIAERFGVLPIKSEIETFQIKNSPN